jgi:hypothetical protein
MKAAKTATPATTDTATVAEVRTDDSNPVSE